MNKIDTEIILNNDETLKMLDELLEKWDQKWWNEFYSDKEKPIPFFVEKPDENLVSFVEKSALKNGVALDIGCGNGRNSIYLATNGYKTKGIDFSDTSIKWAKENAGKKNVEVSFINQSFFDFEETIETYDLIHDSGCLHHIKPHRRSQYLQKIHSLLKSNGHFSLTCFNLKGGVNISDYDVYREASMQGGLGFSEVKMKKVLEPYFEIIEFREMKELNDESTFGKDICWTVLMKKK